MTEISEQEIVAFVDGRLDPAEIATFEMRLASDAELAHRVAAHRWMTQQIVAAYGPPPDQAIDDAMVARLGLMAGNVTSLTANRKASSSGPANRVVRFGSLAASLAAGVLIGNLAFATHDMLAANRDGHVVASGQLAQALSSQFAGQAGIVQIGLSIRTKDGVCRTFSVSHGTSGLACREGDGWTVPIIAADGLTSGPSGDYSLAAGGVAPSVMSEVDRRIIGDPLSVDEERRLKTNGWR